MKVFLVGGAVRDEILDIPFEEKDFLVIGSSPEEMISKGFKPVGKDFPVFLHPKTHEEYALARTEKKQGKGYKGFVFYTNPNITIEEDLKRRDLTINAIAKSESGELIDPFGGINDLRDGILKHVSESFIEDPLRVLRIARFKAKFNKFTIHADTLKILKEMVSNNELETLSYDRVITEIKKVLKLKYGYIFFEILDEIGAFKIIFKTEDNNLSEKLKISFNNSQRLNLEFNLLWNFLQKRYNFKLINNADVFSKKHKQITELYFQLLDQVKQFSILDAQHKNLLLERVGFYGNRSGFNLFLSLYKFDNNISEDQDDQFLSQIRKLDDFFKQNIIKIPMNVDRNQVAQFIKSERQKLINKFYFE